MRLFVAIKLPDEILDELERQQAMLRALRLISGSFVPRRNLHLTLRFLGEIADDEVEHLVNALAKISHPQLFLGLAKLGTFGIGSRAIRIIWAKLVSVQLASLVFQIDQMLEPIIGPRTKDFVSHVTLVRVKSVHRAHHLREVLAHTEPKPIQFNIGSFCLMRSELRDNERKYMQVARFDLGPRQ